MDKEREEKLKSNYKNVLEGFTKSKNTSTNANQNAILLAVSKKRPCEDIEVIYDEWEKIFGENYPQELLEKSKNCKRY